MATNWRILTMFGLPKPSVSGIEFDKTELTLHERMDLAPNILDNITTDEMLYKYMEGDTFNMTRLLDDFDIPKFT